MASGWRFKSIALVSGLLCVIGVIVLALLPPGAAPSSADLVSVLESRDGYVWARGVFNGLELKSGEPQTVAIDGIESPVGSDFTIRRALMRRSFGQWRPTLELLELPDLEGFDEFAGGEAWFESAASSRTVHRVIIVEEPGSTCLTSASSRTPEGRLRK